MSSSFTREFLARAHNKSPSGDRTHEPPEDHHIAGDFGRAWNCLSNGAVRATHAVKDRRVVVCRKKPGLDCFAQIKGSSCSQTRQMRREDRLWLQGRVCVAPQVMSPATQIR